MSDDQGSDLDVFEGLTNKKKSVLAPPPEPPAPSSLPLPAAPAALGTLRGGLNVPAGSPPSVRLMPPPPPSKRAPAASVEVAASPSSPPLPAPSLPKPKLPPPRSAPPSSPSEPPEVDVPANAAAVAFDVPAAASHPTLDEPEEGTLALESGFVPAPPALPSELAPAAAEPAPPESYLPGAPSADLDWDDHEESTSVFGKEIADDLFAGLGGGDHSAGADDTAKRSVGMAAALLAGSGRSASVPPPAVAHGYPAAPPPMESWQQPAPASGYAPQIGPYYDPMAGMPKIPAPAPVPRDLSPAAGYASLPIQSAAPAYAPSVPAPKANGASRVIAILAAVLVMVVGAAGFLYLRASATGTVTIRVTHNGAPVEKADIFVDGQKKCEFTPCRLELEPGAREVRVAAALLAGLSKLEVKGGSDSEVVISLGTSPDTAPTPTAPTTTPSGAPVAAMASLSLRTSMTETVKVFVGGVDKGTLPLELKELAPGELKLRFETTGDGYGKLDKTVQLEAGKTLTLDDVKLPLKTVEVTFELASRGATVKLVQEGGSTESLTFFGDKLIRKLDTTKSFKVVATLKDHKPFELPVKFDGGVAKQSVRIELEKGAVEVAAAPTTADTGTAAPPPDAGGAAFGFINANSRPPSNVLIDGKPQGSTPISGVKVSAGSHTVVFKHKDFGVQTRSASVAAGKTATVTVKFDTEKGAASDDGEKKKKKKKKDDD